MPKVVLEEGRIANWDLGHIEKRAVAYGCGVAETRAATLVYAVQLVFDRVPR